MSSHRLIFDFPHKIPCPTDPFQAPGEDRGFRFFTFYIPPGGLRKAPAETIIQMVGTAVFTGKQPLEGALTDDHTERENIWSRSSIV
jgi:hypothetical protein